METDCPYNYAVGYARGFATLLVLVHHAILAYHPFAPAIPADMPSARWWLAFPVADAQRSELIGLIVGFNDTFLMALLFFVSGLFVWGSLERKGARTFLKERSLRLGLPFIVVAAIVAPLAYYPSYLLSGAEPGLAGFWAMWSRLGNWPAGPAWFLWLLLAFGAIAAGLFAVRPRWGSAIGEDIGRIRRPVTLFAILVGVSVLAYFPLALSFTPSHWTSVGPFSFQTSRLLFYLVYFAFGVGFGAHGLDRALLASDGALARSWFTWCVVAFVSYAAAVMVNVVSSTAGGSPLAWGVLAGGLFVVSCAAISLCFVALFLRFARNRSTVFDSLDRNAYGMYLIHYPIASLFMFALLGFALPALGKAALAVLATVVVSWVATSLLRRIGAVAKVIG